MSGSEPRRAGRRHDRGLVLVALAASSWGTWPLILRHAPMPAALQSAVVMAVLTAVSFPLMRRDRVNAKATARQWLGVAWLGVGDALNVAFFFAAYQRTSVAIAVLTHYLTPIFVAVAAPLVVKEPVRARTFAAVGVAFLGLALLLQPWRAGLTRSDAIGAAFGAASAVFYASNVLVNKRLVRAFSGSELMFFHGVVAVPILFALVPLSAYADASGRALAVLLLGALGPGAAAGLFFVWGLRRVDASHASVLTLLEPFVAVLIASVWLEEPFGAVSALGGALILGGSLMVITGRARPSGDRIESAAS